MNVERILRAQQFAETCGFAGDAENLDGCEGGRPGFENRLLGCGDEWFELSYLCRIKGAQQDCGARKIVGFGKGRKDTASVSLFGDRGQDLLAQGGAEIWHRLGKLVEVRDGGTHHRRREMAVTTMAYC